MAKKTPVPLSDVFEGLLGGIKKRICCCATVELQEMALKKTVPRLKKIYDGLGDLPQA